MYADRFDYRTAAGLHQARLDEAESIRRADTVKKAKKKAEAEKRLTERVPAIKLKHRIGRQLIAIGEKLTA